MTLSLIAPLIGGAAGLGLVLIGRAFVSRPVPLSISLARLERVGVSVADPVGVGGATRGAALLPRIGSIALGDLEADLAVLERTRERHAMEKLTTAVALMGLPLLLAVALAAAGSGVPLGLVVTGSLLGLGVGFVVPDLTVRSQATARRNGFRHALSSYLDLVNVLLAGGAGVETALEAAAESGDGWAFVAIRDALERSRVTRTSPWATFAEMGRRLGVDELTELAASVQLAGEQGARIRMSLVAKAAALRTHQMARIEADAQSATERMGLPTVLMFLGFLILLGYPALQMIIGGFGP